MDCYRGNTSDTAITQSWNLPMALTNFTLTNRTGAGINVNVYMLDNETAVGIGQGTIDALDVYKDEFRRLVRIGEKVKLVTTGNCDYDFEFDDTQPPL